MVEHGFLRIWQPQVIWTSAKLRTRDDSASQVPPVKTSKREPTRAEVWASLTPWIIVCAVLLLWGTDWFKGLVNPWATLSYEVPGLNNMIAKVAPIAATPTPEKAVFAFTWLSYTGSGMLIAAIISGFIMG
ncbi:L-lactate permease [Phyllobacterium brassicacearum]|nr:L-lactate permease [Phyllobacterium brassicacearum]